jgi:hypothetical protein
LEGLDEIGLASNVEDAIARVQGLVDRIAAAGT